MVSWSGALDPVRKQEGQQGVMKKRKILFSVLCCALLLSACVQGTREEYAVKQGSTTGVQIEENEGKEFFVFQDVEGNK